jgi:long-chain fatty acid transport protein
LGGLTIGTSADAAGYGLNEASAKAMGAAYAGVSATGTDASFLAYNPASLAEVGTYDSSASVIALLPDSSSSYSSATTSAATSAGGSLTPSGYAKAAYIPDIAARFRLSPQWSFGLSIYAPWGLATGYADNWGGRYYAEQTRLTTINITPVIAYQISDRLSIAAGPQIQYAKGTLSNAIDMGTIGYLYSIPGATPGAQDGKGVFKADGWGYGFVIGAMAKITDGVTAGLSYHSAVNHTLKGRLSFTLDSAGVGAALRSAAGVFADTNAQATLTTPDKVNFGLRAKLDSEWTALFESDWTNWSRFQELRVVSTNPYQPDDVTLAHWQDVWLFALGAEYAPEGNWTWRGGVALDQSPIPDSTYGPRIPDADRYWVSLGATYQMKDGWSLDASLAHIFLPDRSVAFSSTTSANALRGNLAGETQVSANAVGLQLNYRM